MYGVAATLFTLLTGTRLPNQDKILSLYHDSINVIKRGKAGAQVEFGNKLWLGETREGVIVDYQIYQDNPSDSNLIKPAIERRIGIFKNVFLGRPLL